VGGASRVTRLIGPNDLPSATAFARRVEVSFRATYRVPSSSPPYLSQRCVGGQSCFRRVRAHRRQGATERYAQGWAGQSLPAAQGHVKNRWPNPAATVHL